MIHNHNNTLDVIQKTTYTPMNSWAFVLEPSDLQKTSNSDGQRNINSKMSSFIADWELPQLVEI